MFTYKSAIATTVLSPHTPYLQYVYIMSLTLRWILTRMTCFFVLEAQHWAVGR